MDDWLEALQSTKPKSTLYTNGPNRLKDAAAVSSHWHYCWRKVSCHPYLCMQHMSFPLAAFKISLFITDFESRLIMKHVGIV